MNAYAYKASLYCESCGEMVKAKCRHLDTGDSNDYPQGPYGNGGGEADTPQSCDHCHTFLENPLTDDGRAYVLEAIETGDLEGSAVLREWSEFYGINATA